MQNFPEVRSRTTVVLSATTSFQRWDCVSHCLGHEKQEGFSENASTYGGLAFTKLSAGMSWTRICFQELTNYLDTTWKTEQRHFANIPWWNSFANYKFVKLHPSERGPRAVAKPGGWLGLCTKELQTIYLTSKRIDFPAFPQLRSTDCSKWSNVGT